MTTPKGPSNPNSFEVALPVRQLPDGTVRVGHDPPPSSGERITIPVVPNEPKGPSPQTDIEVAADIAVEHAAFTSGVLEMATPLVTRLRGHAKTYAEMASLLRELEWLEDKECVSGDGLSCPCCKEVKAYRGHSPDCRLAALLRSLP